MIKFVTKLWGSEAWLVNTDKYCAKYLNLVEGYQCSLHYHKIKDETFYVLDGKIELELSNKTLLLKKGDSHRLRPGDIHRFRAITPQAKILEISTTHYDEDSYRLEKSCKIKEG
jgi:mannose-6-phosphate isomerase-like protein (cupin superfamily)